MRRSVYSPSNLTKQSRTASIAEAASISIQREARYVAFDLGLSDEQQALRETLRDFASAVLRPAARDAEKAGAIPDGLRKQFHEIGVGAPVDERYGGGGTFDAVTYCIAAEELGWGDAGIAHALLGEGFAALVIGAAGTEDQKDGFLPRFVEPEPIKTFVAIGESLAAGDLASLETLCDGEKVSGKKYGVTGADSAAFGVVVGRDGAQLTASLVEGGTFEVLKKEAKLGLEASETFVVNFDGAGQPLSSGPELERAVLLSKLATGALALGSARASFEYASEYAKEREAFGKPIGAFQAIAFKIADMAIEVDAARVSLWHAAWRLDQGEDAAADVAAAVGQALHTAILCGDDGVQVLGGHGYVQDHPVEMWFRNAVTLSVFDAPDLLGDMVVARSLVRAGAGV